MNIKYLLFLTLTAMQLPTFASGWQEIVAQPGTYTDPKGTAVRTLQPACSGGPVCTFDAQGKPICHLADKQFSFFFQEGDLDHEESGGNHNLLIYLDQGGACWDFASCVASAETSTPVYAQAIDRASIGYAQTTGILADRKGNPFRYWDKVFVPACTGDVFWGSNNAFYYNVGVDGQRLPGIDTDFIEIHHRGFDNFLTALNWAGNKYTNNPPYLPLNKIAVAGSSAGGYGAVTSFAFVKETWPDSKTYLIADAANGVIGPAFTNTILKPTAENPSPWGQQNNLPTWIPGIAALPSSSDQFIPDFIASLAKYYAKPSLLDRGYGPSKFAQYTTEWDVDQAFYYGAMQENLDPSIPVELLFSVFLGGGLNPDSPTYSAQKQIYCDWHRTMKQYTHDLVDETANADNYRYYRAAGHDHTILTETPPFVLADGSQIIFNQQGIFYSERSAGVPFKDWIKGMLSESEGAWKNQQCSGGQCNPPGYVVCR